MEFYAERAQPLIGPVDLLPQAGAQPGPTGRPPNAYAIALPGRTILFDAPFSWALTDLDARGAGGHPAGVLVLSHGHLIESGDAFRALIGERGLRVVLHPADRGPRAAAVLRGAFHGLHEVSLPEGARFLHLPGHTAGSIVLYLPMAGGIVLAGDSAVGAAPGETGPLRRPRLGRGSYPAFAQAWMTFVRTNPLAAVLPLHGAPLLRSQTPEFDRLVANVWEGEALDPAPHAA
jgi:glyoxylase-like metal-dependent hydrolase (beta-lactamase superfamily II)